MEEIIKEAFKHLNAFKRYRAMYETAQYKNDRDQATLLELKMYKSFDQLELSLRGIQRENREESE